MKYEIVQFNNYFPFIALSHLLTHLQQTTFENIVTKGEISYLGLSNDTILTTFVSYLYMLK